MGTVEGVASSQDRSGHRRAFAGGEGRAEIGRVRRDHRVPLGPELVGDRRQRETVARRPRQVAVVLLGHARHRHERVPTTVRAASKVRAIRRLAVGRSDQRLGHRCQLGSRLVAVVQTRLEVDAKAGIVASGVARVGADDGKALLQGRRLHGTATAEGRGHAAIQPAIGLVEEASVPRFRQPHLEADRVALAVLRARPPIHLAFDQAVRADGVTTPRQGAGRRPARPR